MKRSSYSTRDYVGRAAPLFTALLLTLQPAVSAQDSAQLINSLSATQQKVRIAAVRALGQASEADRQKAFHALVDRFAVEDKAGVRIALLRSIVKLHSDTTTVVDVVRKAQKDADATVREEAVRSAGRAFITGTGELAVAILPLVSGGRCDNLPIEAGSDLASANNLPANITHVLLTQELKKGMDQCVAKMVKSYVSRPPQSLELLGTLPKAKDKAAALLVALEIVDGCRSDPTTYSNCAAAAKTFQASIAGAGISDAGFLENSRQLNSAIDGIEATVAGRRIPRIIRPYVGWPILVLLLLSIGTIIALSAVLIHTRGRMLRETKDHAREIETNNTDHSRQLEELRKDHVLEIEKIETSYSGQLEKLRRGHALEIEKINTSYSNRLSELEHSAELRAARAALEQFTPLPPELRRNNIEVAAAFRQCAGVAGDFFNWYTTNNGDTWIYLVDVEGRGFRAAIMSTLIRHVLDSTLESADDADPQEVLSRVDRQFEHYGTGGGLAATMNLFRVSTNKKVLELANAGMPAPLMIRYGQSQPDPVQAAGVYVGSGYSHYKVEPALARETIAIGDLIVAYSDGVIGGRNAAGIPWGVEGLSSQVMRYRDTDIEEIAKRIIEGVKAHSGTEIAQDDQCVVVIRIGSNAERRRENSAPTIDVKRRGSGADAQIEFTIVNSIDAMREISIKLRPQALEWAREVKWDGDLERLWMGVFEAILNSLRHGTGKGDRIRVTFRSENSIAVVELEQPNEWRGWDKSLGPDRRALVDKVARLAPDLPQWGTLLMLWYSDSLDVFQQGRLFRMNFRPKWRKEEK